MKSTCPGLVSSAVAWMRLIRSSQIRTSVTNFIHYASPQRRNWGVCTSCVTLIRKTVDRNVCRLLQPLQWLYAMLLSEKVVVLQKKCDECWLIGWRVRCPVHPPDHVHVFHGQQASASWSCLFLSDYGALFQVHVRKVVSDPDIDASISSVKQENFHRKHHTRNAYPH
jgi:hypothetical protein